jgi:toxin ParE1/3/4
MNQFRVSAAAKSDLNEIWIYIAQDNPDAADKFIRAIVSRFPKFATMPEFGRRREELSPRLRSFPVGRYVIFYRPMENGIEVVRVLHGARDLPPFFE